MQLPLAALHDGPLPQSQRLSAREVREPAALSHAQPMAHTTTGRTQQAEGPDASRARRLRSPASLPARSPAVPPCAIGPPRVALPQFHSQPQMFLTAPLHSHLHDPNPNPNPNPSPNPNPPLPSLAQGVPAGEPRLAVPPLLQGVQARLSPLLGGVSACQRVGVWGLRFLSLPRVFTFCLKSFAFDVCICTHNTSGVPRPRASGCMVPG